jgi:hypothetical protein
VYLFVELNECIALYGFPEEGHDKEQLQEILDYLGCACCIVSQFRVGLSARSNLPRPIKLELKSAMLLTFCCLRCGLLDARNITPVSSSTGGLLRMW